VLERVGADLSRVEFIDIQTNRGWTRDTGPIFVKKPGGSGAVVDFHFRAWSKYQDYDHDINVPAGVAARLRRKLFDARVGRDRFTVEGGAIDVNGRGTLMTTEECMLDDTIQPRNPGMTKAEIEAGFREHLGVANILWLRRGIAGDDTHGHIDDLCRFVSRNTVVLCREKNAKDDNYAALEENRELLESFRLENGRTIAVVDLPMPEPLYFDGRRLPASYANFYIANSAVLVPTFNDPNDRIALGILSELFPDRRVVGIHCVDLVWGLGTIHCMTQQEPL
jgi:agmatine deiminase